MRFRKVITKLLVLTCICIVGLMIYLLFKRKSKHLPEFEEDEEPNATMPMNINATEIPVSKDHDIQYLKYQESPGVVRQLKKMKEFIQQVNERQHVINNENYRGLDFDHTVLVIRVHPNKDYLTLFLDSIRRIQGIRKSFLIFAHDHYNEEIDKVITNIPFLRIIQIIYPYSVQLHPYVFPGDDSRYCQKINHCINSDKRDPVLSQAKLFWWWVTNQVFDHIEVLKNYHGYIYFLETYQYLSRDFIAMAKLLELMQPKLCSKCRILSLGSYPPRVELYRPQSVSFIIGVWGWSNYSNSAFGFNRTTWDEIKRLRFQFCYFRDPSWENSLKHLASKTHENKLYMLFLEAPRFFPLTGCGAFRDGTDCNLGTVYRDTVKFLDTIRYWEGNPTFSVTLDSALLENEVEARGQWGDARDMDFCMFFSSSGRRLYY